MHVTAALQRCAELYREGGLQELSRGIRDYFEYDFGEDYQERRNDNEERWEFISSYIHKDDTSLLDVGCAEGEFVGRAAGMGLSASGFDRNGMRIETAKKKYKSLSNIRFERAELSPETIDELPETDIILFLTLHHHWVRAYGWDGAETMFRTLLHKADIVVYEPPGNIDLTAPSGDGKLSPGDSVDHYTAMLESEFGDAARIIDVMTTSYREGSERSDPIFILDSTDY